MKKIFTIFTVLIVAAMFTGCSLLPKISSVEDKIDPISVAELFNYDGIDYNEGEVLVKVHQNNSLEKLIQKEGSEIIKMWPEIGWALISVPPGETTISYIEKLRKSSGILLVEPNMEYYIDAFDLVEGTSVQWAFDNINAKDAWEITTGDPNVIVAIIDSGVQVDHPEFLGKEFIGTYDVTTKLGGVENMYDLNGHGTHVAGIAADDGESGQIGGMAWDCPIMPLRVEDNAGKIWTTYLIDAMLYLAKFAEENPEYRIVANMSIGGRSYSFAFKDAIDLAWDHGVLLVTSAGNDAKRLISYPSAYNGLVCVAASTPHDIKADFSTEGWWNDVAAPGVQIFSTYTGSSYRNMQGTSMASPYACGAAALLLSANPDLTPLEIKNQLEMTARGTDFSEGLGHGILDAAALLGDLKEMQYGSLDVMTNIVPTAEGDWIGTGVMTLFDHNNRLVGFGTTGEYGNYKFQALKPGGYNINVTYFDQFKNEYKSESVMAVVTKGFNTDVEVTLPVPSSIDKTELFSDEIDIAESSKMIEHRVTESGPYEFKTSRLVDDCDTYLTLYDADNNVLAINDDYLDMYSQIRAHLQPGVYKIKVSEFNGTEPLKCVFTISELTVTY